jgi:hypothetical protein
VFCSPRDSPLDARNVRRAFDWLVKSAGVSAVDPHDVGQTHITYAAVPLSTETSICVGLETLPPSTCVSTGTSS